MTERTCKSCAHYCLDRPGARQGTCRAKSPVVMLLGMEQINQLPGLKMNGAHSMRPITQGFFPPVAEHIWCGEWAPQDARHMSGIGAVVHGPRALIAKADKPGGAA